jgi:hypothetical protein
VRGCEVSRRSERGYCVHINTQRGCFGGDEADFALQTRVECSAAEGNWNWSWSGLIKVALAYPSRRSRPRSPDKPVGREHDGIGRACVQRC